MSLRLRLALFLVAVFCLGEWLIVRTARIVLQKPVQGLALAGGTSRLQHRIAAAVATGCLGGKDRSVHVTRLHR